MDGGRRGERSMMSHIAPSVSDERDIKVENRQRENY